MKTFANIIYPNNAAITGTLKAKLANNYLNEL